MTGTPSPPTGMPGEEALRTAARNIAKAAAITVRALEAHAAGSAETNNIGLEAMIYSELRALLSEKQLEAGTTDQQSVMLGLVAAKIAIAGLEGSRRFVSAAEAFESIRVSLNEMIKDARSLSPAAGEGGEDKSLLPQREWRKDSWGHEERALFLGGLYVGHIMPGSLNHHSGEWRGWFQGDEDGSETGWFATAYLAQRSVEDALTAALTPTPKAGE